jgi:hypothetical protein
VVLQCGQRVSGTRAALVPARGEGSAPLGSARLHSRSPTAPAGLRAAPCQAEEPATATVAVAVSGVWACW